MIKKLFEFNKNERCYKYRHEQQGGNTCGPELHGASESTVVFARYELLTAINNPTELHHARERLFMRAARQRKAGGTDTTAARFRRLDATGCSFDAF